MDRSSNASNYSFFIIKHSGLISWIIFIFSFECFSVQLEKATLDAM